MTTNPLEIFKLNSKTSLEAVPRNSLELTLAGELSGKVIEFFVGLGESELVIGGVWSPEMRRASPDRDPVFTPGIWRSEALEFFVSVGGSAYLEFNLSPWGAWWGAGFSDYRKQERELNEGRSDSLLLVGEETDVYLVLLRYPLASLPNSFSGLKGRQNRLLANISAVTSGDCFLSWNTKVQDKPDFHDPDLREEVLWRVCSS